MTASNALAYFAQVAVIVAACAGLPRLLGLRSPSVQHVFWRAVLAVCLLLPFAQPLQPQEMVFVPAPIGAAPPAAAAASAASTAPAAARVDWAALAAMVMLIGVSLRVGWIGAGLARLRRLRRGAAEPALGFDDLRQMIGVGGVPILWSADTPHPVTFGALNPVVLLPVALKSVDRAAQRAVVAHELHHVRRRDWLWTIGEEVLRSLFWFHPAMWWLISRVQLARETVVDELSILTTNARRAYLDTLLAFADDGGLQSSTAFSARRHLFHRVMLLSKEGSMSSTRVAAASCLLALSLAGGTWKAVSAFPLRGDTIVREAEPSSQVAQKPPRDPRSPADYYRLAQEYWEKANKDLSLTPEQKLEVVIKGIDLEDRALAIDPDYANALMGKSLFLRMQARLTADTQMQSKLLTQAEELREKALAAMPPPPPPPPPPPGAGGRGGVPGGVVSGVPDGSMPPPLLSPPPSSYPAFPSYEGFDQLVQDLKPLRVGSNVKQPTKIHDVRPVYPPIAQQARVNGVVVVEALIAADGTVAAARVLRSIPLLDQAALDAVRQWEFTPMLLNGAPQAVVMTVTVNFTQQ